jgi:hypothetical protein
VGALIAIAMNGPDAPRQAGLGPPGSLPSTLTVDPPGDTPSTAVSSRSPSRSPSPSPSASRSANPSPSASPSPSPVPPRTYEAEAPGNVIRSGARIDQMDGASGGAGVYGIGGTNLGTLRFTGIVAPAAGVYTVKVYYQNPGTGARVAWLSVNGGNATRMDVGSTGGCCVRTHTITATLHRGSDNTVEVGNPDARAPDIDRIVVSS